MQSSTRFRHHAARIGRQAFRDDRLLVAIGLSVSLVAGAAIAAGGRRAFLAIAFGAVAAGWTMVAPIMRGRWKGNFVAVELPALLILLSEVVIRQRDAQSLASNPLDPAGLYRVACIGLALLLGSLAITSPAGSLSDRTTTRPVRLYGLYIVVVFIGAPLSVNLPLTAYRGVELVACVVVIAGAYRRVGSEGPRRILTLIYWVAVFSAIIVWLEALIVPGSAFAPVDSPFPVQLHGVFPVVSANGTGLLGATIGLWSLAQLLSPQDRTGASRRALRVLSVLGFATLILAQYRTGYIATVAGLLVILAFRARVAAFWLVIVLTLMAVVWGGQLTRQAVPVLERGANTDVLNSLSGRLTYWDSAVDTWRESPYFGGGLLTASRFEVLAKLGAVYTSSIHGTWIEALVGTGVIGLSLLAASFLISITRAVKEAIRPDGLVVPLVLLTILAVRSITGPTFEVAGTDSLVFLAIAMILRDRPITGSVEHRTARPYAKT